MVDYVLRRKRRPKMNKDERSELLERIAPQAASKAEAEAAEPNTTPKAERTPTPVRQPQQNPWDSLPLIPVNEHLMDENLIITAKRHDPAHASFDVLRTRLVQTLADKGWSRVAITSPTKGCGKSFVAINLAIALSRYESHRTVLMDMDLRDPSLATLLGVDDPGSMGAFLHGDRPLTQHFHRFGANSLKIGQRLAIAMNDTPETYAAEILAEPQTHERLREMEHALKPDIVLYDLLPALAHDDVIAFREMFDGVLIVAGGGDTTASEIREVMRRLGDNIPLLGVVLNKADDAPVDEYAY